MTVDLLKINDVAKELAVSSKTVYRLIRARVLDTIIIGNRNIRISRQSLEKYIHFLSNTTKNNREKGLDEPLKNSRLYTDSDSQEGNMKDIHIKNSWRIRESYIYIRKQVDGFKYVVYSGRDENEALRKLAEFNLRIYSKQPVNNDIQFFENDNILFKDYALRYLEEISKPFHRAYKDDRVRFNAVLPFLEHKTLKEITYPLIKAYVVNRQKQYTRSTLNEDGSRKSIAPATINRELTFISGVLSEAQRDGLIEKHPLKGMKLKLEEKQKQIHPITDYEDIIRLCNCFSRECKLIVEFAIYTGFRLNTILSLRKDSFNSDNNTIVILKQHAKNKKEQVFPLSEKAVSILKSVQNDSEYFFPNPSTGRPYTHFHMIFKRGVKQAGLNPKISFHDLRRTFGTNLVREGFPLKVVSKAMGHCSTGVTERYLRVSEEKDIRPMLEMYADKIKAQDIKDQA